MEKLKVHWVTQEHNITGNALGYATHNKFMRKYSEAYMEFDDTSNIALHIVPADQFHPIPGKFNILFSMWEFLDLPDTYIENLKKADHIIVPSSFCRDLFKPIVDVQVDVCYEGVEAESYPFHKRSKNGKFRFLWVGAPNPRKGYPWLIQAAKMIEKMPNVEIYLKTTMPKMSWKKTFVNAWKKRKLFFTNPTVKSKDNIGFTRAWWQSIVRAIRRIPKPYYAGRLKTWGKHKNIHLDSRYLSFDELIELYNSAHCFVLPHCGEGWGLTLCEAMATGAPCIATPTTGCADFFDDSVGFPLDYREEKQDLDNYDLKDARGYVPNMDSVIANMMFVMNNYKLALNKGEKAHRRISTKFTWEKSGRRLNEILRGIYVNNA